MAFLLSSPSLHQPSVGLASDGAQPAGAGSSPAERSIEKEEKGNLPP